MKLARLTGCKTLKVDFFNACGCRYYRLGKFMKHRSITAWTLVGVAFAHALVAAAAKNSFDPLRSLIRAALSYSQSGTKDEFSEPPTAGSSLDAEVRFQVTLNSFLSPRGRNYLSSASYRYSEGSLNTSVSHVMGPIVRGTRCIKTAWKAICEEAGVTGATPKTLRHTMLTWLAERGVPKEQRMTLAGHSAQDTTAKNYEHLSPQYLRAAVAEIDAYFDALAKLTTTHLRYKNDTGSIEPLAA